MIEKKINLISQMKSFGLGPVVCMFIGLLTTPIITRLLLPVEFGKASLFGLVQNFFQLFAVFGFDQAYVRFYNEETDKRKLLITSIFIPFCISFISVIVILIFHLKVSEFMFGSYEPFAIVLLCLFFPFCLVYSFSMLNIRMNFRGKAYSFITFLNQILNFVFLLGFLFFYERTFRSVVYAGVLSTIVASLVSFLLSGCFSLKISLPDIKLLKKMLFYGLPLVPSSLLVWIMNSFDRVAIRSFASFDELGLYEAAIKIVAIVNVLKDVFSTTWAPVAFAWHSESFNTNNKFNNVNVAVCSIMSIIFAGIIVFRNLILLLLGPEYRNTEQIFMFLILCPIFYTMAETSGLGIYFSKKTIYKLLFTTIAAVLNIFGNNLLVPSFGAIGAAISTAISYTIWFYGVTLVSRKNWFKFRLDIYFYNFIIIFSFMFNILFLKNIIVEVLIFIISLVYNISTLFKIFAKQIRAFVYGLSRYNLGCFRSIPKFVAAMLRKDCNDFESEYLLKLNTYDGSNQVVHPDLIKFNNKIVFTCTPYPLGTDYYENPCVYYGEDIHDLKPIKHNPIAVSALNRPGCHLCDPCLFNYKNTLYLFYLDALNIGQNRYCDFYRMESLDINKWSKKILVKRFELSSLGTEYYVCPAVISYGTKKFFFAVHSKNQSDSSLIMTTSDDFNFTNQFHDVNIFGIPNDYSLWHINICYKNDGSKNHKENESSVLLGLFLLRNKTSPSDYISVIAVSEIAGEPWYIKDFIKIPEELKLDCDALYKGSIVPFHNAEKTSLVFSYRDKNHVWKICAFPYNLKNLL